MTENAKAIDGLEYQARFIGDRIAYPLKHNAIYSITITKSCYFFPISVKGHLPGGTYPTKYFELFYNDDDSLFSEWDTIIE